MIFYKIDYFQLLTVQHQKASLKDLNNLVKLPYATAWRQLGEKLGIPNGYLSLLQKDHPNDSWFCCGEVLKKWRDLLLHGALCKRPLILLK